MGYREWNDLPGTKTYTISAKNGWAMTLNPDGTITMRHGGGASSQAAANTSMTIDPDPGTGTPVPPGK